MRAHHLALPVLAAAAFGCHGFERDNPVDVEGSAAAADGGEPAALVLSIPLPKALAVVVDSLVARLEGPDMPTVVKALDYAGPLGPAQLTIGALSPGQDRTLTIEGYDLSGRLILSGSRSGITVVARDTTRIAIDLRLAVAPEDLTSSDPAAAADTATAAAADTTVGAAGRRRGADETGTGAG